MNYYFTEEYPIAQKDYLCDACQWACERFCCGYFDIPIKLWEAKLYVKAMRAGFKIKKGQKYLKVRQIIDGKFCTFRARPEMDTLCRKYDVYEYV